MLYLICHSVENFDTICYLRLTMFMEKINKGFTLIELLITLVIAAILVTIAVPNFSGLIQNNRFATHTNRLIADLNFARSEAIKRGAPVLASAIDDDWAKGVTVKLSGSTDTEFLRQSTSSESAISIRTDGDTDITFFASGRTNSALSNLTLCDTRGDDFGRVISIGQTGRIAIRNNDADCD